MAVDVRKKLVEIIQNSVGGCARYWAELIADGLINNGVTVQEWISVKDRLPEPFTPVLVYRQSFGTLPPYIKVDKMTLWNDDTQVWIDEVGNWKNVTTHWMPLPQPLEGE
jgi:hypothetical protein